MTLSGVDAREEAQALFRKRLEAAKETLRWLTSRGDTLILSSQLGAPGHDDLDTWVESLREHAWRLREAGEALRAIQTPCGCSVPGCGCEFLA